MKGAQGLLISAFFGVVALVLNFVYLEQRTRDANTVSFLGVAPGASIKMGDAIRESDLVEVRIPARNANTLKNFAYLFEDRRTIVDTHATRDYQEGDFIHREDYKTPAQELSLGPNQRLVMISVDGRGFVPSLVNPGDEISFVVPGQIPGEPTPADGAAGSEPTLLGPFVVGSIGNRLGSINVMTANRVAAAHDRLLGIVVTEQNGQLEEKARRLLKVSQGSNRSLAVVLHPRKTR